MKNTTLPKKCGQDSNWRILVSYMIFIWILMFLKASVVSYMIFIWILMFLKASLEKYKLDPAHFLTAPRMSWVHVWILLSVPMSLLFSWDIGTHDLSRYEHRQTAPPDRHKQSIHFFLKNSIHFMLMYHFVKYNAICLRERNYLIRSSSHLSSI